MVTASILLTDDLIRREKFHQVLSNGMQDDWLYSYTLLDSWNYTDGAASC